VLFWIRKRPRERGAAFEVALEPREYEGESKEKVCGGKVNNL
jgi:hypothetical protein